MAQPEQSAVAVAVKIQLEDWKMDYPEVPVVAVVTMLVPEALRHQVKDL
jgi:hypothetical protein